MPLSCKRAQPVEHFTERPAEFKEEIFKLLFEYADIATFSPEEKIQYELDMTTEADRINQLNFAKEEGAKNQARKTAKVLLGRGVSEDIIVDSTGLSPEEIRALQD